MLEARFHYKGFAGSEEVSIADNCVFGRILLIDDIILYEANTSEQLEAAFQEAVEHYIEHCKTGERNASQRVAGF